MSVASKVAWSEPEQAVNTHWIKAEEFLHIDVESHEREKQFTVVPENCISIDLSNLYSPCNSPRSMDDGKRQIDLKDQTEVTLGSKFIWNAVSEELQERIGEMVESIYTLDEGPALFFYNGAYYELIASRNKQQDVVRAWLKPISKRISDFIIAKNMEIERYVLKNFLHYNENEILKCQYDHVVGDQINGNNGSATNSDDVDMVNITPDFALHGKYVGPGWTGGKFTKGKRGNFSVKPVDELDAAARVHDYQYQEDPDNKGHADLALSKRAWKVARKEGFSKLGLKSALVGAGMGIMSHFGSKKNKSKLHFERIVSNKPERLNGNNGSATNTDDVNKVKVGRKKRTTMKGKILRAVKRGNKQIKLRRKKVGRSSKNDISTNIMPTSLQSVSQIRPGNKVLKVLKDGLVVQNTINLGTITASNAASSSGVYIANQVIYSVQVDRTLFIGTETDQYLGAFEFGHLQSSKLSYVTGLSSATSGLIYFMTDPDATDLMPRLSTMNPNTIASHKRPVERTVWMSARNIPCTLNRGKIWLDPTLVSDSSETPVPGNQEDVRLNSAGVINVILGSAMATSTTALGDLWLTTVWKLSSNQRSDMSNLVCNARWTGGLANVSSLTTTVAIDPIAASVGIPITSNAANYEFAYNPSNFTSTMKFFSGATASATAFRLPIGTYLITYSLYIIKNGATISSVTPSISSTVSDTYSYWRFDAPETVLDTNIEFTSGNKAVYAGVDYSYKAAYILRIVQTGGLNARSNMALSVAFAFTGGTLQIAGATSHVCRIPTFDSNPIAAKFPRGTANGNVGFVSHKEEMLLKYFYEGDNSDKNWSIKQLLKIQNNDLLGMKQYGDDIYDYVVKMLLINFTNSDEDTPTIKKSNKPYLEVNETFEEEKSPIEVIENPLTKSVHMSTGAAHALLSLVGRK